IQPRQKMVRMTKEDLKTLALLPKLLHVLRKLANEAQELQGLAQTLNLLAPASQAGVPTEYLLAKGGEAAIKPRPAPIATPPISLPEPPGINPPGIKREVGGEYGPASTLPTPAPVDPSEVAAAKIKRLEAQQAYLEMHRQIRYGSKTPTPVTNGEAS